MSAQNPMPDDLRTIAKNLRAEGQTSRAEVLENVAAKLEKSEEALIAYGFVGVLCGHCGRSYLRCQGCNGDNHVHGKSGANHREVKHDPRCELAALLDSRA